MTNRIEHLAEGLAELIWELDGPRYSGWPNIGERVDWCYRDQHPSERDRCFKLAHAAIRHMQPETKREVAG